MNNGEGYGELVREVFKLAQAVCMGCLDAIDTWSPTDENIECMNDAAYMLHKTLADDFGIRGII